MSQRRYPKAIETPAHPNQIFSKVRQKWVVLTPEAAGGKKSARVPPFLP